MSVYLVSDKGPVACGPVPLAACPCCGGGFRPGRAWRWIDAEAIVGQGFKGQAGLLWVNSRTYKDPGKYPDDLMAKRWRLAHVPRGFVSGETVVFLAHRRGANGGPGIFASWQPWIEGDEEGI